MGLALNLLGENALKQVVRFVNRDPEHGMQTLLDWMQKLPLDSEIKEKVDIGRKALQEQDNNWRQLAKRFFTEVHPNCRERLVVNMLLNAWFFGVPRQNKNSEKYGVNIPYALLIDPTSRCNLRCTGCWAGDYDRASELDYAELDRVIGEARDLGIYFILFSGGEPLLRKDDLLALASKYNDMAFQAFTNGTLIDEQLARDAARLGNLGFAVSVEGFRESTDNRRGQGAFDKITGAMDLLQEAGCIFGFSATYTRHNTEELGSDEFIDFMVTRGCTFGWYFTYIPIGADEDLDLMATPRQRAFMYRQMQHFRETKPIAVFDFWNDGDLVNGCIAGGRRYLHINSSGEVEPCAFVHFATHNIKDISLLEALDTPLMKAYQKRQPFNNNMLCPCPIIDNPEALAEMVNESGARATQLSHCTDVGEFTDKLKTYADSWGKVADTIRSEEVTNSDASVS